MLQNNKNILYVVAFGALLSLSGCASQSQQQETSELRGQLRVAERNLEASERRNSELEQRAERAEARAEELAQQNRALERRMERMEARLGTAQTSKN